MAEREQRPSCMGVNGMENPRSPVPCRPCMVAVLGTSITMQRPPSMKRWHQRVPENVSGMEEALPFSR